MGTGKSDSKLQVIHTPSIEIVYSQEAEKAVIGSILIDKAGIMVAMDLNLTPEDFFDPCNKTVYTCCMQLTATGTPIDLVTVREQLHKEGYTDPSYVLYLVEVSSIVSNASNIEYHARIVIERSMLRKMMAMGNWMVKQCTDTGVDAFELLDKIEKLVLKLNRTNIKSSFKPVSQLIQEQIQYIEGLKSNSTPIGIMTGLNEYDRIIGGFRNSTLNVIAGRPGMGKTAVMVRLARNIAVYSQKNVVVFSIEMSGSQLTARLLSMESGYDFQRIRDGKLTQEEVYMLAAERLNLLNKSSMVIDDTNPLGIHTLKAKIRKIVSDRPIDIIFIDYLQLMKFDGSVNKFMNRERQVAEVSMGLKAIAKEFNIPVIALAQLGRGVTERRGNRPTLTDLRETGQIEADADTVTLLHRPEYYGITADEEGNPRTGQIEFIIDKNRDGATGSAWLGFNGTNVDIYNLDSNPNSSQSFAPSDRFNTPNIQPGMDYKSRQANDDIYSGESDTPPF